MEESNGIIHNGTTLLTQANKKQVHQKIVWRNVMLFAYLHVAALYGVFLIFTSAKISTTIFAILMYQVSSIGITAGAHRLWSHRAYKAKWPLRIILIIFNTIAFQIWLIIIGVKSGFLCKKIFLMNTCCLMGVTYVCVSLHVESIKKRIQHTYQKYLRQGANEEYPWCKVYLVFSSILYVTLLFLQTKLKL